MFVMEIYRRGFILLLLLLVCYLEPYLNPNPKPWVSSFFVDPFLFPSFMFQVYIVALFHKLYCWFFTSLYVSQASEIILIVTHSWEWWSICREICLGPFRSGVFQAREFCCPLWTTTWALTLIASKVKISFQIYCISLAVCVLENTLC